LSRYLQSARLRTRYILLGVLIGLLIIGLLVALDGLRWPEFLRSVIFFFRVAGWALRFWDRQFLFGGLVVLWIAFMLSVVIHELGHFVVGRAVGLRLHTLQLGPFRFSFEFGNLRVRIVPAIVMGGYAAMHIRTCARLRRKLAKFVFAGLGTNLVCGMLALTLVRIPRFLPSVRVWSTLALC
jgi:peptidase M50-like protein